MKVLVTGATGYAGFYAAIALREAGHHVYGLDGKSSITGMWFQMGEQGKAIYRGNKNKGWSWVHVRDLAEAYVRAVESSKAIDGEVFCIADEQRPKCLEIMQACLKATGYSGEIEFAEPQEDDVTSTVRRK